MKRLLIPRPIDTLSWRRAQTKRASWCLGLGCLHRILPWSVLYLVCFLMPQCTEQRVLRTVGKPEWQSNDLVRHPLVQDPHTLIMLVHHFAREL